MNPHVVSWEIQYRDGRVVRERDGIAYGNIDRRDVDLVALHYPGVGRFFGLPVNGRRNFFYRRRTQMRQGAGSRIVYLLGFYPDLCVEVDPVGQSVREIPVDINPMQAEKSSSEERISLV